MANYAYLRVSGDTQDVNNQKYGILEHSKHLGLSNLVFVEDCVSGVEKWRQRRLGSLFEGVSAGDVIIFSEVTRMVRSKY